MEGWLFTVKRLYSRIFSDTRKVEGEKYPSIRTADVVTKVQNKVLRFVYELWYVVGTVLGWFWQQRALKHVRIVTRVYLALIGPTSVRPSVLISQTV
jgi:hypothetical protein